MRKTKPGFWKLMLLRTTWKEKGEMVFALFMAYIAPALQYWHYTVYQGRELRGPAIVLMPVIWFCLSMLAFTIFFVIHRDAKRRSESDQDEE